VNQITKIGELAPYEKILIIYIIKSGFGDFGLVKIYLVIINKIVISLKNSDICKNHICSENNFFFNYK